MCFFFFFFSNFFLKIVSLIYFMVSEIDSLKIYSLIGNIKMIW